MIKFKFLLQAKQAKFLDAATQAESLPTGVKPLVPEVFKGSMDGESIPKFIY